MEIRIKRAYDQADASDGYRVLVDRLWPRGIKKVDLAINEWCKDIAPSTELRKWFAHDPLKIAEFSARYIDELSASSAPQNVLNRAGKSPLLTLVYAANDPQVNHAVVLQKFIEHLYRDQLH